MLPDNATLKRWIVDEGMTHQQVADRVLKETGNVVSRSSVSAAAHRAGFTRDTPRHSEEVPWKVRPKHMRDYAVRMLRVYARQRAGLDLTPGDEKRLEAWMQRLINDNAVVAYDPNSEYGFFYVERSPEDPVDIPIHRQVIDSSTFI